MRKITALVNIFILFLSSCNLNKSLDYYNMAVGAGNGSLTFEGLERRLERLESGMNLDTLDQAKRIQNRIPYNEKVKGDLNDLLGNDKSDPMIKAAIAYSQFNIDASKNPKTIEVLNALGNARTYEEERNGLEPLDDYLDSIYDIGEELWATYDFEITQYAKKNDIEMKFYRSGAPIE